MNIVITGASRGIGFSLAETFLKEGHHVLGSARKKQAEGLATLHNRYSKAFTPFVVDVTDPSSITAAQTHIEQAIPSLDILINNAGVYLQKDTLSFDQVNPDVILATFEANALGSFRFSQAMHPLLKKADHPKICNISSIIGSIAFQSHAHEYAYTTSKAALNMLTRLMQLQLKSDGIAVLAMHPGWVKTDMGGSQAPLSPAQSAQGIQDQILAWKNDDHPFIDYTGKRLDW